MKYEFLLFDADGTLLDFLRCEDEALREALVEMGLSPDDRMVAEYSRINDSLWKMLERGEIDKDVLVYRRFELLFELYGIELDAKEMAGKYVNNLSKKGYVLDGARALCESLYGKARMFIVTNGVEFIQRGRYDRCGLDGYFEDIFISDCIGFNKPDVRYFLGVAEKISGFDKKKAIIIGDSLTSDMRGGLNYGIDTCWYNPAGKPCPEGIELTYVANSFDDIYRFITCGE